MIITRTVTKKILENLVHETFTQFGNLSSSSLLDSLKLLGFYYATNTHPGKVVKTNSMSERRSKESLCFVQ